MSLSVPSTFVVYHCDIGGIMLLTCFDPVRECEESMFHNKPTRKPRQDARTLPTYTLPEAASILAINRWTLADWYEGEDPLLKASGTYLDNGTIKLLSFRDLEEAYKVQLLRTKHSKSMQYLQRALPDARRESGSEHPLLDHKVLVFDHLALDTPAKGKRPRRMIPLGAPAQMTLYLPDVIETWGKRIVEDEKGRGKQIFPWRNAKNDDVSRPVSVSPEVLSGRLVVTGTRIPVEVLASYFVSGKTVEQIAELYRLEVETVRKALQHLEPELQKVS
jgi:uncharacterized protein (DUF433 family)